jgi:hypothetical protein
MTFIYKAAVLAKAAQPDSASAENINLILQPQADVNYSVFPFFSWYFFSSLYFRNKGKKRSTTI